MDSQEANLISELVSKYGVRRVLGVVLARAYYEAEGASSTEEKSMWERLSDGLETAEKAASAVEGDFFKDRS